MSSSSRKPNRSAWVVRCALGMAGALTVAIAVIGVAHTTWGRPLLGWLAKTGGCPVSLHSLDPAAVERHRIEQAVARRGHALAGERPALAFVLGHTTRAEVLRTLREAGSDCRILRKGSALSCGGASQCVGGEPAPRLEDVHAAFDSGGRLVALDLFRAGVGEREALEYLDRVERVLNARVGAPTRRHGRWSTGGLSRPLARVALEYRYRDYLADVSALRIGDRGVRVREQYQWIPDGA